MGISAGYSNLAESVAEAIQPGAMPGRLAPSR
jgi:hypothetical protein